MTDEPMQISIIVPAASSGYVAEGLRLITRAIAAKTGEELAGGLGGDDGYGLNYDNDVFTMRPFYWGECDCTVMDRINGRWYDLGLDEHPGGCKCEQCTTYREWAEQQGDCLPTCSTVLPNFVYKPTGAAVEWYKYIGRGMEVAGELPLDFAAVCITSLGEQ